MQRQSGYIPVTGGNIWYETVKIGNKVPLLTLHGGPGTPHNYLAPLAALADERQVIFYDQLGCGKSDRPHNTGLWQRSRFLEEVIQVREALHLDEFHLFGHSWGSMLAVDYALTKPQGLKSLILASPALSIPRWMQDMECYRKSLPAKVQSTLKKHEKRGTTETEAYQHASMAFYREHLCRHSPWPKPLKQAIALEGAEVYEAMWGPAEFYMTGNLLGYDCTPRLKEITIPTLFTCGRYDEATPETTAYYRGFVSKSELAVFSQSAHMAHLEESRRYNQTVRNFLRRVDEANI